MVSPFSASERRPGREVAGEVQVRVPAKVNLFLAVRGRRPDGFHEIVSVMHTVGLYDRVTVRLEGPPGSWSHPAARRRMDVLLEHDAGDAVPRDASNLAVRAALALADTRGIREMAASRHAADRPITRVELAKRIPVGAGMAGGSADAAATLIALNRLWDMDLDVEELQDVAATLGADVPFCVTGGTALASGTGTATARVLSRGTYHWVVGVQEQPLSTADVYAAWDEVGRPSEVEPDAVLHALRTQDPEALGAALHNDLDAAAFHLRPGLRDARDALCAAGAFGAVVSGSGPTLIALAEDADAASAIAQATAGHFAAAEVVRSPGGGPEVLTPR